MNRVGACDSGRFEDVLDVEIAVRREGASDQQRLVHRPSMQRGPVRLRVDADRPDPHLPRRPRDPNRDLAPIRDQQSSEHWFLIRAGCCRASSPVGSLVSSGGRRTRRSRGAAFPTVRMMPSYSCSYPGRNPGTSTKVSRGMLKQSQNRTNLAALIDALMSSVPAWTFGWFPTTPTGRPSRRAKPMTIFWAHSSWTSNQESRSTTCQMTSRMSYGLSDSFGTTCESSASARDASS